MLVDFEISTNTRVENDAILTFIMRPFGSPSHQIVPFGPCLTR